MARGKLPIFDRRSADGRLLGYQVRIRKKGWPAVSKQYDRRDDAERFAISTLRDMSAGSWVDRREAERMTLAEALDTYAAEVTVGKKGAAQELRRIKCWKAHRLAKCSMAAIRRTDVATYRDERLKQVGPNTVRLELAVLSHLFTIAIKEWGLGVENPVRAIRMPKLPQGRDRRLVDDEEKRLLAAADEGPHWLRPLIVFAVETAMRLGELLALQWDNTNVTDRTATLEDTKNGERRVVPLSPAAIEVLVSLPRAIGGAVFGVTPSQVEKAFASARAAAKIEGLRFHDLRHEATSRLVARGNLGIVEISSITGHKTLAMLKRYTHPDPKELAKKLAAPMPVAAPAPKRGRPQKVIAGGEIVSIDQGRSKLGEE